MLTLMSLFMLSGCDYFTLPSDEGAFTGRLKKGLRLPVRERKYILPGTSSTPPPPEVAVHAEQCDDLEDGGPLMGEDCVTGFINCGDTIIGHTRGGVQRFDTKFYEKQFCTPATTQHDGGDERVYRLTMPEGEWKAFVTLDTPCADLDLAALRWSDDTCPTRRHLVPQCEMYPRDGHTREQVELVSQGQGNWLIIVEGKGDEEGAFALHVQCRPGLM